jgi:hypothetical protein
MSVEGARIRVVGNAKGSSEASHDGVFPLIETSRF